jgi:hypothetical protein
VSVSVSLDGGRPLGMACNSFFYDLSADVRVWSKSVKERDEVSADVIRCFALANDDFVMNGYDVNPFVLASSSDVSEEGRAGVHSRIMSFKTVYVGV